MVHTIALIFQLVFTFLVCGFIMRIAYSLFEDDLKEMFHNTINVFNILINYPELKKMEKRKEQQERIRALEQELGFDPDSQK